MSAELSQSPSSSPLFSLSGADIDRAAKRIAPVVTPTPLQPSDRLSAITGATVYLKREDLQTVRSYKLRGAYNLLVQLSDEELAAGVVCSSAGNHAQGFAYACRCLGVHGRVYVPAKTPKQKRDRIRYHGGEFIDLIVGGSTYDLAAAAALEDVERTGATLVPPFDDLRTIAGQGTIAVEVLGQLEDEPDLVVVPVGGGGCIAGITTYLAEARAKHFDVVIVDTAGRLGIDEELMAQAAAIRDAINPDEVLFVLDAMIGQDAVTTAAAFGEGVGFTGVALTKLDGDARGGAALSVREVTGVPILFASTGEKLEDFDVFHPDRMASRILGMGDVLSLIEQAEQVFDAQQAEEAAAKIGAGELTLEDFLEQMLAVRKMGPIGNLLGMLPGAAQMKDALAEVDDKQLDRVQAIIRGMTPQERADPKIINASRRLRIANGSGVTVSEVNQLVERFFEARKMMSSMLGGMGIPGIGRKSATRKSKGAKGKSGKKSKKGTRGPTPPKVKSPFGVPGMPGLAGLPGGLPDLSQMPKGLDELPPGLADFDLSKLKFPGKK